MDLLTSTYFILFARLAVGGIFLASSIGKLLDKAGTEAGMSRYPFLPRGWGKLIANYFPFLELVVGLCLVLGLFTRYAAVGAVALLVLFTALITYDLTHNKNVSCHCFGRFSDEKLTPWAVARNAALMALALLVALVFDGWLAVDGSLNEATQGNLGLIAGGPGGISFPALLDAVPVALMALATVGLIVLGGQAMSMIRTTLRGMGFR